MTLLSILLLSALAMGQEAPKSGHLFNNPFMPSVVEGECWRVDADLNMEKIDCPVEADKPKALMVPRWRDCMQNEASTNGRTCFDMIPKEPSEPAYDPRTCSPEVPIKKQDLFACAQSGAAKIMDSFAHKGDGYVPELLRKNCSSIATWEELFACDDAMLVIEEILSKPPSEPREIPATKIERIEHVDDLLDRYVKAGGYPSDFMELFRYTCEAVIGGDSGVADGTTCTYPPRYSCPSQGSWILEISTNGKHWCREVKP
jgi:hypothetical protein